ncbi:xanthine dehydrogenase family protein molybdopterin-binding subunit [Pollutibacter soli]|uniref:xanthine dehydrogenase family protein molybdopterin-binding subunit n=1 Tax=Pollutibacter soli TaxID=3034157 RepID=UPI0030133F01
MSTGYKASRRNFLKISSLTGGGLILGFSWLESEAEVTAIINTSNFAGNLQFNNYLSIGTDGIVTIMSPNPELGQNIMTSFPMIVAEELDADWTKVKAVQAPLDTKAFDRQLTGGSGAVPHSWKRLRQAGAAARQMLIDAAAKKMNVMNNEFTTENGFVIHKSGTRFSYGELAEEASKLPVPTDVKLKEVKDFKLIGTRVKNVENRKIVTGKAGFGLDFYRDGMVFATIQRPPAFGSKIKSVDDTAAKAMPGVTEVVRFGNNVAVVGKSTWEIFKAKKVLKIEYEHDSKLESTADHQAIFTEMMSSDKPQVKRKDGNVDAAFASAAKVIRNEYQCPFIAHSPMEPMNFFAHVREDGIELVGPLQLPASSRAAVSKLLNVPEEKITVDITRLGGGFGRRLKSDYVLEAAELSSIIKKPVKLIWSREDDMMGGSYRPAVRYRFEAALDASGNLIGYKLRGVGINVGNAVREDNFPSGAVENLLIESVDYQSPITTGAWRAPITNFLAFAEQSFIDEVAKAAGKDPFTFRNELLEKAKTSPVGAVKYNPNRFQAVMNEVKKRSQWGEKKGVHQGFSVYFSHASYVAQVAEVAMEAGKPVVKKVIAACDCGVVINKSGAEQQVKGGIVDGYGHAMFGKLSFKDGVPQESNFNNYRLVRMKEIPEVETWFVENEIDPTGLGEPALPPTGGAVANAIFKATGTRMKNQPFIEEPLFNKPPVKSSVKPSGKPA